MRKTHPCIMLFIFLFVVCWLYVNRRLLKSQKTSKKVKKTELGSPPDHKHTNVETRESRLDSPVPLAALLVVVCGTKNVAPTCFFPRFSEFFSSSTRCGCRRLAGAYAVGLGAQMMEIHREMREIQCDPVNATLS